MLSKWKSRFGILAVLAMIAAVLAIVPASAAETNTGQVNTGAVVGGESGLAPQIICKWELPDRGGDWRNLMTYGNDETPSVNAGGPCQGTDPNMTYNANEVVIDVKANAEDYPTEQYIELWAAVRGSRGVSDVSTVIFDVYHPDGTLKIQAHASKSTKTVEELGAVYNGTTAQWSATSGSMWYAASMSQTGQIARETIASEQGIISRVSQNELSLWSTEFPLSKHQPCGEYKVSLTAAFLGFTTVDPVVNYINVLCFTNLEADFQSVNWGDITPGGTDYVYGDRNFDLGLNSAWPTVRNTGSGAMALSIQFSPMKAKEDKDPDSIKLITEFDAAFGINPSYLRTLDPIAANKRVSFGTGYYQILCANETGKLDLSIHPPVGVLPAGTYVGTLTLWGTHAPSEVDEYRSPCLNENGIWNPPAVRGSAPS